MNAWNKTIISFWYKDMEAKGWVLGLHAFTPPRYKHARYPEGSQAVASVERQAVQPAWDSGVGWGKGCLGYASLL